MKDTRISKFAAWALAFGCAVGSDAFVMPWIDFLPKAGPLGTVIGILIGGLVMTIVAWNFHYMINRQPGPVLVVTADVELRDKSLEMGFNGILLKPITPEALNQALSEACK